MWYDLAGFAAMFLNSQYIFQVLYKSKPVYVYVYIYTYCKTNKKEHVNIAYPSVLNNGCLHINVQYKFVNMNI